jgi:intein/homing endonuclease
VSAKAIQEFKVGDLVLSRDEFDPHGPIQAKVVEELFVRQSLVWELRLGTRLIRTTAEHPFSRNGEWVNANELRIGDRVLCESGMTVTVEGARETNDLETVYNFRIADHHTYFVGESDDGTAVWAHNSNGCSLSELAHTPVFRAVTGSEYLQLVRTGLWAPAPSGNLVKYFATTVEHALDWGRRLNPGEVIYIIEAMLPTGHRIFQRGSSNVRFIQMLDNIGPAWIIHNKILNDFRVIPKPFGI